MNVWVIKALCNKYTDLAALGLTNISVDGMTVKFQLRNGQTASVTIPTPDVNCSYSEDVVTESNTWVITHKLDTPWYQLTIEAYDDDNEKLIGKIDSQRSTNNLLVIEFSEKVKGKITVKK